MEPRSAQEVIALMDVAYVVCYGHFPNPDNNDSATKPHKDSKPPIVIVSEVSTPITPPNSPLDEGNTFSEDGNPFSEDGNPFSGEDNPFPEDGNPFADEVNDSEEDGNPFTDDSNPFSEDDPDHPAAPQKEDESQSNELAQNLQDPNQKPPSTTTTIIPPESGDEATSISQPSTASDPPPPTQPEAQLSLELQMTPRTEIDPISPFAKAMALQDVKSVSQSLAKEIVSEAFNLTRLDLNRLVEDTLNSQASPTVELLVEEIRTEGLPVSFSSEIYPILFLRARVGGEDRFTNFSSTSATNTIQQSLTMGIQNMYNDTLFMEVWSANVLPPEDPETPPKLDLLGKIMTGSIRLKKDDTRHGKIIKLSKDTPKEEPQVDSEIDTSHDSSRQSPSPNAPRANTDEGTNDVSNDGELQNGDTVDHEDPSQSLDMSDSVSVASEVSTNDPIQTSTPREMSSSLQHLEATSTGDGFHRKKGLRSSFKMKASNFLRSSHANLMKSNQNLCADSASPNLSRKGSDAHSIQSESISNGKGKLDRESSKSTLSISSLSRTFSMRLSAKKAVGPLKRFGSVRAKKSQDLPVVIPPSNDQKPPEPLSTQDNPSPVLQNEGPDKSDAGDHASPVGEYHDDDLSHHTNEDVQPISPRTSSRKLLSPRQMRPFKNLKLSLKGKIEGKDESRELSPTPKSPPIEKIQKARIPSNPEEIQKYLTQIGKGNLQAERLAYTTVPIKSIIGKWMKEGWIAMTLTSTKDKDVTPNEMKTKKKKGDKTNASDSSKVIEKDAKVLCRMHIKLALPVPFESDLEKTAFDSYNSTYSKLVNLQIRSMKDLTDYKGTVGVVGDIVLEQLAFFSRVGVCHQKLVSWLVMAEKKPSDSTLLFPFLATIKEGLDGGQYVTAQKLKLGDSLSNWVRYIIPKEFEMLHSSFPSSSHLLHLPRLENFLRCFNIIEDSELRILFEREMNLMFLPSLTDQLKGALVKNAEIWIEALNKEPLNKAPNLNLEALPGTAEESKWHDSLRRAAHLTKPIDDFVVICVHTYQPIFMTEMSVDYLYWVLPKFLTAALHLIQKTHRFSLSKVKNLPKDYRPSAAQAIWNICSNISSINKTGVDSRLPLHLIEKDFRTAYSNTILQWLTLSETLSLDELDNDLQQEEFVAIDAVKGYSHSAVSMVDILKAIMSRIKGLCWPGGMRPGVNMLTKIGRQIVSLVKEYTSKITRSYTSRGCNTDRIPTQVCVVVRNVEHVCDEARQHLSFLASLASDGDEVEEELPADEDSDGKELQPEGRNQNLQRQIDYTAEILLQRCLPKLEQILTQGVSRDSPDFVIRNLETSLQPIEDRLYFAEPLLYELWNRLFQHAMHLKGTYLQGLWRRDLLRLQKVLTGIYTFLTDSQRVGFQLREEDVQDYEALIDELKLVGASSAGLIAKYYSERYHEQCKEIGSKTTPIIVANITFSKDEGLRVYIAQAPGNARAGVLVKARVEPQEWFPNALPQKTRLVKAEQAVFDETLHFYELPRDGPLEETDECIDIGGSLVLQIRTPKLFVGSVVHHEAIVPLAEVARINKATSNSVQHLRLPLTRPWSAKNYKSLETLRNRPMDAPAMNFLKVWHGRWEGSDDSATTLQDSLRVNSKLIRAGSLRISGMSSRRKASMRDTTVK